MLALAVFSAYLLKKHKNKLVSLITAIPCAFMGSVTLSYILMADEGLQLNGIFEVAYGKFPVIFCIMFLPRYFIGVKECCSVIY